MTQREGAPTGERICLLHGDCREVMASLDACSVDAIVTDPPYDLTNRTPDVKACRDCGRVLGGADGKPDACPRCGGVLEYQRSQGGRGFMGKAWDGTGVAFDVATWEAAYRILKPGAHLVAFGAPRTYHRMACAIEDAGFEIRDSLMWLFGSGFPKSLDVSKALDKAAGAERAIIGSRSDGGGGGGAGTFDDDAFQWSRELPITAPATDLARTWEGWGTALKPAYEPIVLARKPLQGTVAGNVERWGTGGLNIEATRIEGAPRTTHADGNWTGNSATDAIFPMGNVAANVPAGRWPANVLLDAEAARLLDAMSGELTSGEYSGLRNGDKFRDVYSDFKGTDPDKDAHPGSRGGASRFFYTAKSSRREREFGLDDLEPTRRSDGRDKDIENPRLRTNERRNDHPTVKPVDLMRWLCRLITPPNGTILDPFMGSGSTGMAALDEGFRFIGIDMDEHYIEIARRRIARRHVLEPLPQRETGQGVLL